MKAEMS